MEYHPQIDDEKAEAADYEAAEAVREQPVAKKHLQEILNVLKTGRLLHGLPEATLSFLLSVASEPAKDRAKIAAEDAAETRKHLKVVLDLFRARNIMVHINVPLGTMWFIEKMNSQPPKESLGRSLTEVAMKQEHLNNILTLLTRRNLLLKLPDATTLFMLKHTPNAVNTIHQQMDGDDYGNEGYGERYSDDRDAYLRNLVLMSRLPGGADTAFELATQCAVPEMWGYGDTTCNGYLQRLDHFALGIVCEEFRHDPMLEDDGTCHLKSYVDVILREPPWEEFAWDSVKELMQEVQGNTRRWRKWPDARREALKHLLHEHDAESVARRVWFSLTLRYLYAIHLKRVANFLIPRIAGHLLPVELQDTIATFYYDEEFFLEVPIIAQKNAPTTSLVKEEVEDPENVDGGHTLTEESGSDDTEL
ncbi:hypothetical protein CKM354_000790100 [Cercospora kikuchii]|uniref:Uncharacterized protein n=1 Tax=Cercospora kikuchii TaxID=84275 RepID=A0A9P3CS13_9PEZI|nr:uncharacterized protein CKM354_000790100 [Cercospora kikuchii]GIZ44710.1 hypothetical protein CKM354_000790100 [Cercospora kikuchii]